jgi:hypothetical protein
VVSTGGRSRWGRINNPHTQDRVANISTVLRGDSLTGFEEKIQELTTSTDDTGETVTIEMTDETISASLNAVAQMVFPFRALETQKQRMQHRIRKPKELPFGSPCLLSEDLITVYHSFLLHSKESDKFTPGEIVEILWNGPFPKSGEPNLT